MIDVTPHQEIQIGFDQFSKLKQHYAHSILPKYDPRSVVVTKVGQRIVQVVDGYDAYSWEFVVIDSPEINAFCLPGGKVAVFTGLLEKVVSSEDELAACISHEIGHALARHGAEKMGFVKILFLFQVVLGLVFDMRVLTDMVVALFGSLPFSRKLEYEADHIGLILMTESCFDPNASARLFKKMGEIMKQNGHAVPAYLSTHPNDAQRIKFIQGLIPEILSKYGNNCTYKYRAGY